MEIKKYSELNSNEKELYLSLIKNGLKRYYIDTVTPEYLAETYKKCFYCDCELGLGLYSIEHIKNPESSAVVDLINPDINKKENIVLCCRNCNPSKGKKTLEEWLENLKDGKTSLTKEKTDKIIENITHLIEPIQKSV